MLGSDVAAVDFADGDLLVTGSPATLNVGIEAVGADLEGKL